MKESKKLNKGSAGQNRKASRVFLEKFATQPGVQISDSGLMYRELEAGSGMSPTMEDSVEVNQRVLAVGGKVIADTYKTGLPDVFSMKEAIPGLQEALLLMVEGARFEIIVPPELAWGKKGAGNKIGPNMVLQFDLRLLKVLF